MKLLVLSTDDRDPSSHGEETVKLLVLSTDDRDSWPIDGKPPRRPHSPGETVVVKSSFRGPMAFVGLRLGPDDRIQTIGPRVRPKDGEGSASWRIDEVKIDDVAIDHAAVLRVAAQGAPAIGCSMRGDFGVGSCVEMRATHVGSEPAYFYATWELEDLQ